MAKIIVEDNRLYEKDLNNQGYKLIAGCDEAGRGPLCGPVVAAAVILPIGYTLDGLTDSKQLSEKKREYFFEIIKKDAISYGIAQCSAKEIDEINIYEASRLAMKRALEKLNPSPDYIITDAMPLPDYPNAMPIIKGDAKSITIAAASILAKVTRDHILMELDKEYPEYGFAKHKGYPTKLHLEKIKKYGILDNYRISYKPVRDYLEGLNDKN
jgi:ribonuclease HII